MTPEQEAKLNELYEWMLRKRVQQIDFPLDDASRVAANLYLKEGVSTTSLTQSIIISGDPETINVPAAYAGKLSAVLGGERYTIPFL
jgi:hypothetical protein